MKKINITKALRIYEAMKKAGLYPASVELTSALVPLEKKLDEVQSKAKVRTLTAKSIIDTVFKIEKRLPHKYNNSMEGVQVVYNGNAQAFPKSYKYEPLATIVKIEFKNSNWRIIDIKRDTCTSKEYQFTLPEKLLDEIKDDYKLGCFMR